MYVVRLVGWLVKSLLVAGPRVVETVAQQLECGDGNLPDLDDATFRGVATRRYGRPSVQAD